ncbi:MAG: hypothetical protein C0404_05585 [Verrucomicrobia bacterium]|nr:hypothetical protein [Verrucomicrobiota bacterium]
MSGDKAHFRLLVTVKAYPCVSTKYAELVCCAGITDDKRWVRLYPVPYRDLPGHKQFEKYDIVEVDATKRASYKDDRPESWQPNLDTMRVAGHLDVNRGNWDARMEWIKPTLLPGFARLQELQQNDNVSLGAFRPSRILAVKVSPDEADWSPSQKNVINQRGLFSEKEPLEKIPYRFQLGFEDELGKDHWLSVIDWEFYQLWRKERDRLGNPKKAAEQVKKKLETISGADKDLILFAGNLAHPAMRKSFMILGCCYPKRSLQTQFNF